MILRFTHLNLIKLRHKKVVSIWSVLMNLLRCKYDREPLCSAPETSSRTFITTTNYQYSALDSNSSPEIIIINTITWISHFFTWKKSVFINFKKIVSIKTGCRQIDFYDTIVGIYEITELRKYFEKKTAKKNLHIFIFHLKIYFH